jgi:archaellin
VAGVFADSGLSPQGSWEVLAVTASGSSLVFCDDNTGSGQSMAVSSSVTAPSRISVRDSEVYVKNNAGGSTIDLNVIVSQVS